jgi:hypothetical protein
MQRFMVKRDALIEDESWLSVIRPRSILELPNR